MPRGRRAQTPPPPRHQERATDEDPSRTRQATHRDNRQWTPRALPRGFLPQPGPTEQTELAAARHRPKHTNTRQATRGPDAHHESAVQSHRGAVLHKQQRPPHAPSHGHRQKHRARGNAHTMRGGGVRRHVPHRGMARCGTDPAAHAKQGDRRRRRGTLTRAHRAAHTRTGARRRF